MAKGSFHISWKRTTIPGAFYEMFIVFWLNQWRPPPYPTYKILGNSSREFFLTCSSWSGLRASCCVLTHNKKLRMNSWTSFILLTNKTKRKTICGLKFIYFPFLSPQQCKFLKPEDYITNYFTYIFLSNLPHSNGEISSTMTHLAMSFTSSASSATVMMPLPRKTIKMLEKQTCQANNQAST